MGGVINSRLGVKTGKEKPGGMAEKSGKGAGEAFNGCPSTIKGLWTKKEKEGIGKGKLVQTRFEKALQKKRTPGGPRQTTARINKKEQKTEKKTTRRMSTTFENENITRSPP